MKTGSGEPQKLGKFCRSCVPHPEALYEKHFFQHKLSGQNPKAPILRPKRPHINFFVGMLGSEKGSILDCRKIPDIPFLGVEVKTKENHPKHQGSFTPLDPSKKPQTNRENSWKHSKHQILASLWLSALASQLRFRFPLLLEASRLSMLNFRIGVPIIDRGTIATTLFAAKF